MSDNEANNNNLDGASLGPFQAPNDPPNPNQNQNVPPALQNQQTVVPLKPQQLTQFASNLKYNKHFYEKNTTRPAGQATIKCVPEDHPTLLAVCNAWGSRTRSPLFLIPTEGTGTIAASTKTCGGQQYANADLSGYRDMTDPRSKPLKVEEVDAFLGYLYGDDNAALQAPTNKIYHVLTTTDATNLSLVNTQRMELRKADDMAFDFLRDCVDPVSFMRFQLRQDEFTFTHEADPTQIFRSGLKLLSMILGNVRPIAAVSVKHLQANLEAITLEGCNYNWSDYATNVTDALQQLDANNGTYCLRTVSTAIFTEAEGMDNKEWLAEVYANKRSYNKEESTLPEVLAELTKKYTDMAADGTWGQISKEHEQIIALTTQVGTLKKSLAAASMKQPIPRKAKKDDPSPPPPEKKGFGAPSWQITRKGPTMKHPDSGDEMVWCPHHKSKDGAVNGMYMKCPHNHEEWEANKAKHRAERQAKKGAKRKTNGNPKDDKESNKKRGSINDNASKLTLAQSFKTALVTQLCINSDQADELIANCETESQLKE